MELILLISFKYFEDNHVINFNKNLVKVVDDILDDRSFSHKF